VRGGRRRVVAPDLLDQPPDRHDLAFAKEERSEHGPLLGASQRDVIAADPRLERTEYPQLHDMPRRRHLA
jgi:hypothetical protein